MVWTIENTCSFIVGPELRCKEYENITRPETSLCLRGHPVRLLPSDNPDLRMNVQKRLEELRAILRSESISYGELHELQDFGARGLIAPDDVELLEAAGVPERPDEEGR